MTIVAAFDFDGTLCRGDSLLPFLRFVAGRRAVRRALARHSPALAAMTAGWADRDAVKERLVSSLLAGRDAVDVMSAGEAYADELVGRLQPAILEQVRRHAVVGHRLVLVSASLAVYLAPLGRHLGFDAVLATELEDVDGVLTGRYRGRNCRGAEKVARLHTAVADASFLYAYGDSAGDAELLARADVPCHVRRSPLPPVLSVQ